ncbi:MAG: hypothetical protein H0V79_02985 [Actinobacteria bacterium]|nr:hypothetical protein [Actinomycetota bacterium]
MKNRLTRGRPALTLFAVAAAAGMFAFVSNSSALIGEESANGHGTLPAVNEDGKTVKRQFSFSARRDTDGTVKGQAVLHNPAFEGANGAPYQLKVDITCMKVYGNIAVFGGTTKRTNDPNPVDSVYFSVQDNGEPGKDRDKISRVFFFDDDPLTTGDPQLCLLTGPVDFPLETIQSGNIQVRGTL